MRLDRQFSFCYDRSERVNCAFDLQFFCHECVFLRNARCSVDKLPSKRIPQLGRNAAAPMKIGYLVPEFPNQTHIFFWREILALRRLGESIVLLSTRRPPSQACRHEFASSARAETRYLLPPQVSTLRLWDFEGSPGLFPALAYRKQLRIA